METKRLEDLLSQMTLDEKIGQLTQLGASFFDGASQQEKVTGPMAELGLSDLSNIGSVLGAGSR